MHIIYTRDGISPGEFDGLKILPFGEAVLSGGGDFGAVRRGMEGHSGGLYADFRRLFPETGAGKLPRPETLLREAPVPFLTAADLDIRLTVYPSGLYLYREAGEATVYAVSRCASFQYDSVEGTFTLTKAETAELP